MAPERRRLPDYRCLTASLPMKNDGKLEDDPASFWVSVYFQGRLLLNFQGVVMGR